MSHCIDNDSNHFQVPDRNVLIKQSAILLQQLYPLLIYRKHAYILHAQTPSEFLKDYALPFLFHFQPFRSFGTLVNVSTLFKGSPK